MAVIQKWKACQKCRGVGNLGSISPKNQILAGMESLPCTCTNGMVRVTRAAAEPGRSEWPEYHTHLDHLFKTTR